MKALTVRQPWAHAVLYLGKTIENRTWPTAHRGPLLIHAGSSRAELALGTYPDGTPVPPADRLVFGALLGVVEVLDCVRYEDLGGRRNDPWAEGPWCWLLGNPRPLALPVPYRGTLGLFQVPDGFVRDPAGRLLGPLQLN
jgi:hypothetical protein